MNPTIHEVLEGAAKRLQEKLSIANGYFEAKWIFEEIYVDSMGSKLKWQSTEEVSSPHLERFEEQIRKRLTGVPLAYVLGKVEFLGHELIVNPSVLIPRPETEDLARQITKDLKVETVRCLIDFGCGSGCLGLSLAMYFENSWVGLVDKSESALEVAKENAKNLNVFARCEFLNAEVESLFYKDLFEEVDLIVANPPYIAHDSKDIESSVMEHEPHLALFGGEKGYELIQVWSKIAFKCLKTGGHLYLEIGHDQGDVLTEFFTATMGWSKVKLLKDSVGKDRYFKLKK